MCGSMLREFFLSPKRGRRVWAWAGLVLVVGHALLRAYIKRLINDWLGRFYDAGGAAAEVSSGETEALEQGRARMSALLFEFCLLCLPSVFLHPLFKLVSNRWVLSWRLSLVDAYLEAWDPASTEIENAAQRVHEDTGRFARGIQTCAVVVLDSVLSICVFAPIIVELGSEIQPSDLPDAWLFLLCTAVAAVGVLVSVALGWSLIALEVNNQRVEADLRRTLVLKEEGRCEAPRVERTRALADIAPNEPNGVFGAILSDLKRNYVKLYYKFARFSVWLGAYEQTVILLPYLITGPMLYADRNRISLGMVTRTSHSFSNLFDALNILSDRWVDVTDFLSVMRRLKEFESQVSTSTTRTLIPAVEMRSEMPKTETV